jgi:GrpB-like predicted nucleotidyltransferase (UPF0157 family)
MGKEERNEPLIGGIEKREINLVEHDPLWQLTFQKHAKIITNALSNVALCIEHIGSTSVPGLTAKPIVDMLLVVADSGDEASYLPVLEAAGYVLRVREPGFHEHRMLRTPAKDVHIHVFSHGSSEIDRHLLFRDRLRTNLQDRQLYKETKQKLATQSWSDMNAYADAKTEVIEQIIMAAKADGNTQK